MNVTDEIRRTLSDPKPFYALAGAGDLAAEKLKDAPERLREAPTLLAEAGATLTTLANKIAAEAPERLAKVGSSVQGAAGRGRPDAQALRDLAQTMAIQQVGRLLEAAGKAVETYDELAERGKVFIGRYTGEGETPGGEPAGEGPVTVLVEQVTDEDELTDLAPETGEDAEAFTGRAAKKADRAFAAESAAEAAETFSGETAAEAAEVFEAAAEAAAAAEPESKPKAAKAAKPKPRTSPSTSASAPRKRAAAPKSPRNPKA